MGDTVEGSTTLSGMPGEIIFSTGGGGGASSDFLYCPEDTTEATNTIIGIGSLLAIFHNVLVSEEVIRAS